MWMRIQLVLETIGEETNTMIGKMYFTEKVKVHYRDKEIQTEDDGCHEGEKEVRIEMIEVMYQHRWKFW